MVLPLDQLVAHRRFVRQVAGDLFDNPEDAEDLAQRVLLYAIERPPAHTRQIRGWLRVVTNHLAINLRSADRHRREREARMARHEAIEQDWAVERDDEREAVRQLVRSLSAPYREVLELYYLHEKTAQEVADALQLPLNTVKTRLMRGRRQLLEAVGRRRQRPFFASLVPLWFATRVPRSRWAWSGVGLGAVAVPALGAVLWSSASDRGKDPALLETTPLADAGGLETATTTTPARAPRRSPFLALEQGSVEGALEHEDPRSAARSVDFLVRDPDGLPLADMEVLFLPDAGGPALPAGRSGPSGQGTVSVAQSGRLAIDHPDWVGLWDGVAGLNGSKSLAEIVAAPRRTLRGRIVDPDGRPVQAIVHAHVGLGAKIDAQSASRKGRDGTSKRSDSQGRFALEIGRTNATTVLRVHHEDYAPWRGTKVVDGTTIQLAPKSTATDGGWIRGLVVDHHGDPVPDAEVCFAGRLFTTGAEGRFTIPRMDHYQTARQVRALTSGAPPLQAFAGGRFGTTALQPDPSTTHRIVLAEAAVAVEGYVRDPSGAPCADVEVAFRDQTFAFVPFGSSVEERLSDEQGDAIVRTGADGFFRLYARPDRNYVLRAVRADGAIGESEARVRLDENVVVIARPTQRLLRGAVLDAAGNPVPHATVEAFDTERSLLLGDGFYRRQTKDRTLARTDGDGAFVLPEAPDSLDTVRVLIDGVLCLEAPLDATQREDLTLVLPSLRHVLLEDLGSLPLVLRFYAGSEESPLLLSHPSTSTSPNLSRRTLVRWNGKPVKVAVPAHATHFVAYEDERLSEPLFTSPIPGT